MFLLTVHQEDLALAQAWVYRSERKAMQRLAMYARDHWSEVVEDGDESDAAAADLLFDDEITSEYFSRQTGVSWYSLTEITTGDAKGAWLQPYEEPDDTDAEDNSGAIPESDEDADEGEIEEVEPEQRELQLVAS